MQDAFGEFEVQLALRPGRAIHLIKVVEQIVHGHDIRTRHGLWLPEKMRHMQQIAAMLFQDAIQFEIAVERELVRVRGNCNEVLWKRLSIAKPSGNSQQEVFVGIVEARECTNGVARVGANAEFIDSPDVDGDAHRLV